jgi:hypothetical protein
MPQVKTYTAELRAQVEPAVKARFVAIAKSEDIPLSQLIRRVLKAWDRDIAAKGEAA